MFSKKPEQNLPAMPARTVANGGATFSVIGPNVAIRGDIEASADLHVDGTITGDLVCAALVQGEGSRIEGAITADTARLAGTVKGTITARELVVLKSARIAGDVHYEALTIEQGAQVEGKFAPVGAKAKAADPQPPVLDLGKDDGQNDGQRLSLAS